MTRSVPVWTGKTDDSAIPARVRLRVWERCEGKCAHKLKTKADVADITKARRIKLKHLGQFPEPRQKIKSRGFQRRWTP